MGGYQPKGEYADAPLQEINPRDGLSRQLPRITDPVLAELRAMNEHLAAIRQHLANGSEAR